MQTELTIEPFRPRGIQKDVSPRAVDIAGNRLVVNPVTDALNRRYLSAENAEVGADQNIPGTIPFDPSLPAGTNLVIGTFPDLEKNKLIFFNWNSNGNHGVYSWNPIAGTFTTLIQKSLLNFSNNPRYRITGIGVVQNLLYWTDGLNPQRMINMTRDYSAITDDACINLYKRPPVQGPVLDTGSPGGLILNSSYKTSAIAGNIYQFATRYVFVDNETSALSMYSEYGSSLTDTLSDFTYNGYRVVIAYQSELGPIISKIQLLYRKNNSPDWFVYTEKLVSDFSGTTLNVDFFDDNATILVPQNEANKLFDSVPLSSKALTSFKNRNFLVADVEGYTVDQNQSFSLPKNTSSAHQFKCLKDGGNYSYGPTYYDKDLRTPGATIFKKVSIDYVAGDPLNTGIDSDNRTVVNPTFADNIVPSWAKYVTFCRSQEQNYEKYMQIPVKPMFYVAEGDLKDDSGTAIAIPGNMELYNNGKVYIKGSGTDYLPSPTVNKFVHIHFQVPENIPFIPDSECLIRIITPLTGLDKKTTIPILAFDGQSIVTNNLTGTFDWSASGWNALLSGTTWPNGLIIEVFKIKKTQSKLLYELPKFFKSLPVTLGSVGTDADTFNTSGITAQFKFKNLKIDGKVSDHCYNISALVADITIESPTSVSNNAPIPESEQQVVFENRAIEQVARRAKGDLMTELLTKAADSVNRTIGRNFSSPDSTPSKVPDYRRIPDVPGRAIAYNPNAKQLFRNTTIRYSETYIQDSNINGLSAFDFNNEYPISTQRTPITKLVGAGDVLLAIHQRATTSMYVGKSQIQDSQGNLQVVTTDKVIPDDNELKGKYGSYHPESIQEYRTMVFAFDIFQGVIWKYDNNGQVPVSDQGMKAYFKMKAEQYMIFKDTIAVLGGIDPFNKEYLVTFPAIAGASAANLAGFPGTGVVNTIYKANDTGFVYYWTGSSYAMLLGMNFQGVTSIAAETWAFNWLANGGAGEWTTRYSFIPDAYGYVNNQLISFASGKLWVHNQDINNCNVFYGVKYDRTITAQLNVAPTKNKNWMAMQISTEELCEGDKYTTKASYANTGAFPGTGAIGTLYTANNTGKIYRWDGAAYQEIRETYIVTAANREVQSTYMKRKEFDKQENIFYGPILKDTNTPSSLMKAGTLTLRDGRDMISQVLQVTMTNNCRSLARHHFTNISYVYSAYGF